MGDFWDYLGAPCRCLAASLAKRVEKGGPRAAQERPNKAKKAQERPQDLRERPKRLPREAPKTPKEFEGVPGSTQDKLRKHRESKKARKQPNAAPPKNLCASSGHGGGREALTIIWILYGIKANCREV